MGKSTSKVWDNLPDCDDIFAYDTVRELRVLDRRPGLVYYSIILSIVCYIVIGPLIINKGYLEKEKSMGWILAKVRGPAYDAEGFPWDVFDMNSNPGEQGAVFVPTRVVVTEGQTEDSQYCQSPLHTCQANADCDIGNAELQKAECMAGMCMRRQWCPAENPSNPAVSRVHALNFGDVELFFQSNVHFHRLHVDVSTTNEKAIRYPNKGANTFKLNNILEMTGIEPSDIGSNGATLIVNSLFDCDLDSRECSVNFRMVNVDTTTGFNHVDTHDYWENGVHKRDTRRMYGIRVLTFATGVGARVSLSAIILQLSSAIALCAVARTMADFVLLNVLPERKHYYELKVQETEDFNPPSKS